LTDWIDLDVYLKQDSGNNSNTTIVNYNLVVYADQLKQYDKDQLDHRPLYEAIVQKYNRFENNYIEIDPYLGEVEESPMIDRS
jgi:hypothetical protein